ncbi:CHASE2 domain-containing protein [Aestuariivita boseongensis]|uniref:CHASE2 domain-containing protein n=1 Tax=Aestuariivita boseongensis TaxID=1470562 RepID=UPI000681CB36|nr:adenylate/guanylate cyclase domain-containing protein [Aestuariivita boseongensis]
MLFALLIRIGDPGPVAALRFATFDFFQQIKPREMVPVPVAILDIDDKSLETVGQWPWPRNRVADMVNAATAAGAVAIAFDVVFAEPDRLSPARFVKDNPNLPLLLSSELEGLPDNDQLLAQAFAASRVVVGQTSVRTERGNRDVKREMIEVAHALIGPDPMPYIQKFPDIVQNLPELEASAAGHGVFSVRPEFDGVYRRIPIVMSVQGKYRLGLAPELLRVATGGAPFAIRTNEAGIEGVVVARQLVRTAADGTVWPYLTPSSGARYVSASDLMDGTMQQGRLAGHLVLVGTSAIGLEDFRATPLGVNMAGVEIHAQLLENILTNSLLYRPNYAIAIELLATFILGLLVIILAPALSARLLVGGSVLLLVGYAGFSYYQFAMHRQLVDPSFPVLATMGGIMLMSTVNYLREERQRREIRTAFGQYVSPDLVERLSRNQEALTLGGETRELTLLFSDVRGFTAIAEQFKDDPEGLTALMNRFLTALSNGILETQGTIDKFMGDAVMAFWNAPLDLENHPEAACRSALKMISRVEELNEIRKAEAAERGVEHMPLNVGIGINSGPCVVGNMGSDNRFDYTALGDPVNVASRLEGQSRYYGLPIILGFSTAQFVMGTLAAIEIDMVRVVGKALPENIFALVGDETLREKPEFQKLFRVASQMQVAYREQDWATAEAFLSDMEPLGEALGLDLDMLIDMYRSRIADMRANPPGPDWDGVFSSTKK